MVGGGAGREGIVLVCSAALVRREIVTFIPCADCGVEGSKSIRSVANCRRFRKSFVCPIFPHVFRAFVLAESLSQSSAVFIAFFPVFFCFSIRVPICENAVELVVKS